MVVAVDFERQVVEFESETVLEVDSQSDSILRGRCSSPSPPPSPSPFAEKLATARRLPLAGAV